MTGFPSFRWWYKDISSHLSSLNLAKSKQKTKNFSSLNIQAPITLNDTNGDRQSEGACNLPLQIWSRGSEFIRCHEQAVRISLNPVDILDRRGETSRREVKAWHHFKKKADGVARQWRNGGSRLSKAGHTSDLNLNCVDYLSWVELNSLVKNVHEKMFRDNRRMDQSPS